MNNNKRACNILNESSDKQRECLCWIIRNILKGKSYKRRMKSKKYSGYKDIYDTFDDDQMALLEMLVKEAKKLERSVK